MDSDSTKAPVIGCTYRNHTDGTTSTVIDVHPTRGVTFRQNGSGGGFSDGEVFDHFSAAWFAQDHDPDPIEAGRRRATKHRHAFWTLEVCGGFVAGMTVAGTDYTSPVFETEAEADAEQSRIADELRALAERLGVRVVDVGVAAEIEA